MGSGYVVVTVRYDIHHHHQDATAPSLLNSDDSSCSERMSAYVSLLVRSVLIWGFVGFEIICADPSAIGNINESSVFTTISIYAPGILIVTALYLAILPAKLIVLIRVLKFIATFLAFLGPFSLLMVLVLPPELNWIAYLVVCVMFGMLLTCFYVDDQQENSTGPPTRNDFLLHLIPFVAMMSLLLLQQMTGGDWFVFQAIKVGLWAECAYHFITYVTFIYQQTAGKPKAIQRDEEEEKIINNDDPPAVSSQLSYLMPVGITPF